MTTLKEAAMAYEPKQTKNIAELKSVSTDVEILEAIANEGKENEFTYSYIDINGEQYRVPDTVLKDLKAILAKKPNLKSFSVTKAGQGLNTRYTVIPLD